MIVAGGVNVMVLVEVEVKVGVEIRFAINSGCAVTVITPSAPAIRHNIMSKITARLDLFAAGFLAALAGVCSDPVPLSCDRRARA